MKIENLIFKKNKVYTKSLIDKSLREWDPFHSKVCAGIKKGVIPDFKKDSIVLYLGAAEGYTVSFISDLIEKGKIYALDLSAHSMQKLYLKALERKNIFPLLYDANEINKYKDLITEKVDLIIQDVSQKNQIDISIENSKKFLKKGGFLLLSIKISAITQKKQKHDFFKKLEKDFKIIKKARLEPFEKKHWIVYLKLK